LDVPRRWDVSQPKRARYDDGRATAARADETAAQADGARERGGVMEQQPVGEGWQTHPWVEEGRGRVRFGVAYAPRDDWPLLRDTVLLAEELGADSYWVMDHPLSGADCWTSLAALATCTARIRLGTLAACVYYRTAAQLARDAADVDRLSGGRLVLGVGIGDHREEFRKLGLAFPAVPARQQRLDEAIQVVRGLWGEQPYTFRGAHCQVEGANVRPGPVQRPRVPVLIAGGGERVTLRQVAQHADVSNFGAHEWSGGAFTESDVGRKLDALRRHCEVVGRPFDSVIRSHMAMCVVVRETSAEVAAAVDAIPPSLTEFLSRSIVAGTVREVTAYYRGIVAAGAQYLVAGLMGVGADHTSMRLFATRVLPELQPP
jgi:alkanesulfonate monooxygenase SsuD/methylene tetrahydromethanopterin reductase-like flavin-dependent oxidoreductase (luciferase family)